jgi:carbon-monoxide dehydrogenase large subunit
LNDITISKIGQPVLRKEDIRLLTGDGQFSDDFCLSRQVYVAMVRSPYPHARIKGFDATDALAMPGVLAVYNGQDVIDAGLEPIPHDPVPSTKYDMKLTNPDGGEIFIGPHVLLPTDKARHVGEAVGMVVAENLALASDAAEAVHVEYEELDFVIDAIKALESNSVIVWEKIKENTFVDTTFGNKDATNAAFEAADHIVKAAFHVSRVTGVPLEPRAALASYDIETNRYTLYAGSGGAVRQKTELSKVLGIQSDNLRVLSYDVGGNFGTRNRVYVEFALILWASRMLNRPVKFTSTRSECFQSDYQGRDLQTNVELALDSEGKFLAMRADNISNSGARCVSLSPLGKGAGLITGSYNIPVAMLRARAVYTNTMPTQAYRSSGRPEVTYAIERLIELAALEFGFDPIELRRKNLVPASAMPYRNAVGTLYDSGTYEANMDRTLELSDWEGFDARRKEAEARGKLLGHGFANYVESSIGSPRERAEIEVEPTGKVTVVIGTQPSGQGHETSFAQVVSDMLGQPIENVEIILGDTDIVSVGGGSHSGRSMRHAGTVMLMASLDLIEEGKRRAAVMFDRPANDIDFIDGKFLISDTNYVISLVELAENEPSSPLAAAKTNEMHEPVFPNGAASCEVEVDPETGHVEIMRYTTVDDVGRCINPMIVHGQTHGGIAQGVGQAMWEECYLDPETGQPLCGSFMDYGIPRAHTLPSFTTEIAEVHSPTNPLGIKAGGEGGTTPAMAVMVNSIVNALIPYGITDLQMPMTPLSIWKAIQESKL